ncbi:MULTISPECIES: phosphate/phosphite/phosphonate ABC transporter substrate-binding protein [Chelativorans]|uniref:ABC-type phosphate/phosphonate transport system periplasmic component-like protein n=1 Tax=Chelativorans sp. (strain BNC1) TaxID=266779 RepID=Q11E28_CHESB|nr:MULTISPECIES: PhnD/SsuA/transferrin family substrate-binding protein [Chelativorans]
MLVASSRMYNVAPEVRSLWDGFFDWLSRQADADLEIVAHDAPAPLSELWQRPDLGAVFMCGYPFISMAPELRPIALAAPVALAAWSQAKPLYASHIVVAANNAAKTPKDLFGMTFGWTVRDSQSGYHALRRFLLEGFSSEFRDALPPAKGPFLNPTGIIQAVREGLVDAGPVDAYAFELLRVHAPEKISGVKVIATTPSTPCPLLIASRGTPHSLSDNLRNALLSAHEDAEGAKWLESLQLRRFAEVAIDDYAILAEYPGRIELESLHAW